MNDAISTRKIPENAQLGLVLSLGIFQVEMTSFMFLPHHRDTQAIFYFLTITRKFEIKFGCLICRFGMAGNPKNKRKVVYNSVGSLRVNNVK